MNASAAWRGLESAIVAGDPASAADILSRVGEETAESMVDLGVAPRLCLGMMGDDGVFRAALSGLLGLWDRVRHSDRADVVKGACAEALAARSAATSSAPGTPWPACRELNRMHARALDVSSEAIDVRVVQGLLARWMCTDSPDAEHYCSLLDIEARMIMSSQWNENACYGFLISLPFSEADPRAAVLRGWPGFDGAVSRLLSTIISRSVSWRCSAARRVNVVDRELSMDLIDGLLRAAWGEHDESVAARGIIKRLARKNARAVARMLLGASMSFDARLGLASLLARPEPSEKPRPPCLSADYFDTAHACNTLRIRVPGGEFRGSPPWLVAHSPVLGAMERHGERTTDGSVVVTIPEILLVPADMQHESFVACMRLAYFGDSGARGMTARCVRCAAAWADFLMMDAVLETVSRIAPILFGEATPADTADAVCSLVRTCHDASSGSCVASGTLRLLGEPELDAALDAVAGGDIATRSMVEDAVVIKLVEGLRDKHDERASHRRA